MKTQQWLSHARSRDGGSVRGGRGKHSKQAARAWATRGILATALAVSSLGAVAAAWSAHDAAGHASTRPAAASPASAPGVAWMY